METPTIRELIEALVESTHEHPLMVGIRDTERVLEASLFGMSLPEVSAELARLRARVGEVEQSRDVAIESLNFSEQSEERMRSRLTKLLREREGSCHLWEDDEDNGLDTLAQECVILIWPAQLAAVVASSPEPAKGEQVPGEKSKDARIRALEKENLDFAKWIHRGEYIHFRDIECAACCPTGPCLKDGFVCIIHRAAALAAPGAETEGTL